MNPILTANQGPVCNEFKANDQKASVIQNLFIKTHSGETKTLHNIPAETPISALKELISLTNVPVPPKNQTLTFRGSTLSDNKYLGDYIDIESSTLHMTFSLKGGMEDFQFADIRHHRDENFATENCRWRYVSPGLNLQGTCTNDVCQAYDDTIWIQKGFGKFSMDCEIRTSKCPECYKRVENSQITNCAMYECTYEIEGETVHYEDGKKTNLPGDEVRIYATAPRTSSGTYRTFGLGDPKNWHYLVITTKAFEVYTKKTEDSSCTIA